MFAFYDTLHNTSLLWSALCTLISSNFELSVSALIFSSNLQLLFVTINLIQIDLSALINSRRSRWVSIFFRNSSHADSISSIFLSTVYKSVYNTVWLNKLVKLLLLHYTLWTSKMNFLFLKAKYVFISPILQHANATIIRQSNHYK